MGCGAGTARYAPEDDSVDGQQNPQGAPPERRSAPGGAKATGKATSVGERAAPPVKASAAAPVAASSFRATAIASTVSAMPPPPAPPKPPKGRPREVGPIRATRPSPDSSWYAPPPISEATRPSEAFRAADDGLRQLSGALGAQLDAQEAALADGTWRRARVDAVAAQIAAQPDDGSLIMKR